MLKICDWHWHTCLLKMPLNANHLSTHQLKYTQLQVVCGCLRDVLWNMERSALHAKKAHNRTWLVKDILKSGKVEDSTRRLTVQQGYYPCHLYSDWPYVCVCVYLCVMIVKHQSKGAFSLRALTCAVRTQLNFCSQMATKCQVSICQIIGLQHVAD